MPTLEFKGKQHIHTYHFTVPYRPLKSNYELKQSAECRDQEIPPTEEKTLTIFSLLYR